HMGSAHGAECAGQFALGGVAHGLCRGGDDGEDGPEPARIRHRIISKGFSSVGRNRFIAPSGRAPMAQRTSLIRHAYRPDQIDGSLASKRRNKAIAPYGRWRTRSCPKHYFGANTLPSSHAIMRYMICLLFFSSIIVWPLPCMPASGRTSTVTWPPIE